MQCRGLQAEVALRMLEIQEAYKMLSRAPVEIHEALLSALHLVNMRVNRMAVSRNAW